MLVCAIKKLKGAAFGQPVVSVAGGTASRGWGFTGENGSDVTALLATQPG